MVSLSTRLTSDRLQGDFELAKLDLIAAMDIYRNLPSPNSVSEYSELHARVLLHLSLCRRRYDALYLLVNPF